MDTTRKLSLIIADDEDTIREGIYHAMPWEDLNITVLGQASNGEEAFSLIEKFSPDIVLTDIKMPKCTGLELIKKTKKHFPDINFIIMSGYNDFAYAKTAIQFGVQDYLLKPVKKSELIKNLESLHAKYQLSSKESLYMHHKKEYLYALLTNNTGALPAQHPDISITFDFPLCVVVLTGNYSFNDVANYVSSHFPQNLMDSFEWKDHQIGFFISITKLGEYGYTSVNQLCSHLLTSLSPLSSDILILSIGSVANELNLIAQSYRSALEYLTYTMYEPDVTIFDYSLVDTNTRCPIHINNTYSEQIVGAIHENDIEKVISYLDAFIDWILYIPMPAPSFVRGMCTHLMIDVQKRLAKFDSIQNSILSDMPHQLISQYPTLHAIKEYMLITLSQYALLLHGNCTDQYHPTITKAIAYIEGNIASKLTLEEVALSVHLSKNYFTTLFKDTTGESFRQYLISKKIDYAKNLLEETDITICNLATLLGYEESRSFNRAFKKSTGKTPSEYQKLYHH